MNVPVQMVGRVALTLRALAAAEPTGESTAALARRTGIARPTTHRLLTALNESGLVDRRTDGRWSLGPEIYLLGMTAAPRYDVTTVAEPIVRRLAAKTEESSFYSSRRAEETVCLLREDGSFPLRSHVLHEGIRFPLGVASAGLAILAFLTDGEIQGYLLENDLRADYGEAHSAHEIQERIVATREAGYALNPGLLVEGSWGMAATVFDHNGVPVGALSVTGVEQRFRAARRPLLGELLRRAAHELTTLLVEQQRSR